MVNYECLDSYNIRVDSMATEVEQTLWYKQLPNGIPPIYYICECETMNTQNFQTYNHASEVLRE